MKPSILSYLEEVGIKCAQTLISQRRRLKLIRRSCNCFSKCYGLTHLPFIVHRLRREPPRSFPDMRCHEVKENNQMRPSPQILQIAISACSFRSSASSSSSAIAWGFPLTDKTVSKLISHPIIKKYSLSPFAAAGIRWIASDTGTVPDLSICLSSCSCCICSNSASKSTSSIGSPRLVPVIALEISSLS